MTMLSDPGSPSFRFLAPHAAPSNTLPHGRFHFNYLEEIGRGGLGRVNRMQVTASNSALPHGSFWAVKRLNAQWAAHPAMRARFEREIAAVGAMKHPNIVACHGQNLPNQERFYVMPLYSLSLRRHIAAGGLRGNWRQIALHGATLADALGYAHGKGFIHRDFKPDNVLFNEGGPLVIADWGLGYFVHKNSLVLQHLTVGGMGTEYYCCTEQWATGKSDCRGDVYALGMTLDEWVTGTQRQIRVGQGITGPTTADPSAAGTRFNQVLRWMTSSVRGDRPGSMASVAAALRAAAAMP